MDYARAALVDSAAFRDLLVPRDDVHEGEKQGKREPASPVAPAQVQKTSVKDVDWRKIRLLICGLLASISGIYVRLSLYPGCAPHGAFVLNAAAPAAAIRWPWIKGHNNERRPPRSDPTGAAEFITHMAGALSAGPTARSGDEIKTTYKQIFEVHPRCFGSACLTGQNRISDERGAPGFHTLVISPLSGQNINTEHQLPIGQFTIVIVTIKMHVHTRRAGGLGSVTNWKR
ncbi:hypothetical protein GGX14DRAFT_406702 [Mycena pura]|uniref:Uncharacterized protein n=1 Tax=Mycena pura TaxID=153505 RepID=A0AAD6UTZ2_9AGAR|nr:hypothetical protein GGX14DRAFT_406702 [Mycena pura]